MGINRPKSTENIRPFLLFLVMMTALSLVPMLSHGAVFWDDEMEEGASEFSPAYLASTLIPNGVMAYDTSVKFSGNGSIRLNYPPACQTVTTQNQCGGSAERAIPLTENLYRRVYFRMSGRGPNASASGLFEISVSAHTKMLSTSSTGLNMDWWAMGCCGSKTFNFAAENAPSPTKEIPFYSSITLGDNRWYCIETHEQLNTPGVANGVVQAWVDGVLVLNKTGVMYRLAGNTNRWKSVGIFRQIGIGNVWWDRYATGDTRIGCSGVISQGDTSSPSIPSGVSAR